MEKIELNVMSSKDPKNFRRYDIGDPAVKTQIFGTLYIPLGMKSPDQVKLTVEHP